MMRGIGEVYVDCFGNCDSAFVTSWSSSCRSFQLDQDHDDQLIPLMQHPLQPLFNASLFGCQTEVPGRSSPLTSFRLSDQIDSERDQTCSKSNQHLLFLQTSYQVELRIFQDDNDTPPWDPCRTAGT